MSDIYEEPPDENEQYENLDESLDEEDLPGHPSGPQGARELDLDVVADHAALMEAGADLDDPNLMSLLDGAMDDPDGAEVGDRDDDAGAGWGSDPAPADLDLGPADLDLGDEAGPGTANDALEHEVASGDPDTTGQRPELVIVDTDPADLEQIADDAPGAGSARW